MSASPKDSNTLERYPLAARTRRFLGDSPFGHFIDGQVCRSSSGETLPIYDPSSGIEFARVAAGTQEDVDRAVRSARRAFEDGRWQRIAALEKERRMRRLAQLLDDHRDILTDLDVIDGGVVRAFSPFFIQFGIDITEYYAGWPTKLHGSLPVHTPELVVQEVRTPIGVCASIIPWNGPSAAPLAFVAPLACGNCVVVKPAEQAPLTALLVAQLCIEAGIPPGVINVVQGRGDVVGAELVRHPMIDAISFTGSCDTGRTIANDTEYGLAAGVWTRDLSRAHRAAQRLRVGTVWVNSYQLLLPSVPYGGVKQSGYGRNLGAASMDDYTQLKSVWFKIS